MTNAALKLPSSEAVYEVGTVTSVDDGEISVRTARGERRARRAASCLVAPMVGDEVAVVTTGVHRLFVIAILVAVGDRPTEVTVEGDLTLSARGGSCKISATEGVELRAEGALALASKSLSLRAEEASFVLAQLNVLATTVLAHTSTVRFAAKALDGFFERVSQTAKTWHKKVEELDTLRAGRVDYRTEKEMCLRSENFLVGARNLAKLDADQIHIG